MNHDSSKPSTRKPYVKPVAKRFPLRPEEAVLGSCKTGSTGSGPSSGNCKPAGFCKVAGS